MTDVANGGRSRLECSSPASVFFKKVPEPISRLRPLSSAPLAETIRVLA